MALYPPIIASSMPAFDVTDSYVKIYFSIPEYNARKEIYNIHLTCRYQASNVNALTSLSDIFVRSIYQDEDDASADINRYYVKLYSTNIINQFQTGTVYKVQIRFNGCPVKADEQTGSPTWISPQGDQHEQTYPDVNIDSWSKFFRTGLEYFSEWSTICLIKPIIAPEFTIAQWDVETNNITNNQMADFVGFYEPNENSSETLKAWRLGLYDSNQILLTGTDWMQISAYNYTPDNNTLSFQYSLPYQFEENVNYYLYLDILTRNDYAKRKIYQFHYQPDITNGFNAESSLQTFVNEEDAYIKVHITLAENDISNTPYYIILRRSDTRSAYKIWEDLRYFKISSSQDAEKDYYDFLAESGISYRYIIQKVNSIGNRGPALKDNITKAAQAEGEDTYFGTIGEWQYAYLLGQTGNGDIDNVQQLKLKYDAQISSFDINISESKTDTIGGKYPYIRRNGNMYYKSFPITGIIAAPMDNIQLFVSADSLNDNMSNVYNTFKGNINNFTKQYDFTYERKFRNKVIEFLFNDKPKLYKSMQEGNIFIKIMDVSLSPKQELNRLIYTFSGTAYEIDQANVKAYQKNNFYNVGTYDITFITEGDSDNG